MQAHNELAIAWRLIAFVHGVAGRYVQANEATVHYMEHARRAGNKRLVARSGLGLANGLLPGPTPVPDGIAQCERILEDGARRPPRERHRDVHHRATARDERRVRCRARAVSPGARGAARAGQRRDGGTDRRSTSRASSCWQATWRLPSASCAPTTSSCVRPARPTCCRLSRRCWRASCASRATTTRRWRLSQRGRASAAPTTTSTRRCSGARCARRSWRGAGSSSEAEALARRALGAGTCRPTRRCCRPRRCTDLAEVLLLSGRHDDARAQFMAAADLWATKGDRVSASACTRRPGRRPGDAGRSHLALFSWCSARCRSP